MLENVLVQDTIVMMLEMGYIIVQQRVVVVVVVVVLVLGRRYGELGGEGRGRRGKREGKGIYLARRAM